jgi:two-component system chemotaxis sensor kinase CheA
MFCLSVPRVTDETELMTKPLPPHLRGNRIITGANVLPDGRIALFINPRAVTDKPVHTAAPAYESRPEPPAIAERKRILVVDDSLIARELLRNILLASGYDVSLACDGQEALQHLRSHVTDLVLTDIDMPGMDGLTFTRTVKHDPALRSVPVIIVSSKEDEAQRARGKDAGADAYILKGDFHQNNLLATVKRLLAGDAA